MTFKVETHSPRTVTIACFICIHEHDAFAKVVFMKRYLKHNLCKECDSSSNGFQYLWQDRPSEITVNIYEDKPFLSGVYSSILIPFQLYKTVVVIKCSSNSLPLRLPYYLSLIHISEPTRPY